jgi:hypothetical protein
MNNPGLILYEPPQLMNITNQESTGQFLAFFSLLRVVYWYPTLLIVFICKGNLKMSNESIYFKLGKRIGYWYAANRDTLMRHVIQSILRRLPGGRWLSKFF